MMCSNCTYAGSLNADGAYERAEHLHAACRWPESCTCQHATGSQWQRGKYAAS